MGQRPRSVRSAHRPAWWVASAAAAVLAVGLVGSPASHAGAAERAASAIDPAVQATLDTLEEGETFDFWVYFRDRADLSGAHAIDDWQERGAYVVDRLQETAELTQRALRAKLAVQDIPFQEYWITNAMRVTGDQELVDDIAGRDSVERIGPDRWHYVPSEQVQPASAGAGPDPDRARPIPWNIREINAPEVWQELGSVGEDMVIGTIGTGVQHDHPALADNYRGNQGPVIDHDYHWHDPFLICHLPFQPCDTHGDGTHVTGVAVGSGAYLGDQIGVAPGAQWIAAKGCESLLCSVPGLLSAGQFMLAPTTLAGENPRPGAAPARGAQLLGRVLPGRSVVPGRGAGLGGRRHVPGDGGRRQRRPRMRQRR